MICGTEMIGRLSDSMLGNDCNIYCSHTSLFLFCFLNCFENVDLHVNSKIKIESFQEIPNMCRSGRQIPTIPEC